MELSLCIFGVTVTHSVIPFSACITWNHVPLFSWNTLLSSSTVAVDIDMMSHFFIGLR
jgi:hypothetical protein